MKSTNRTLVVTSALPYANGPLHLGHLLEHIQTDIWVRFQRLTNNSCTFICADDAHGTAIMLKAEELQIREEELIDEVYKSHIQDFQDFNISHDNYHSTHSEENRLLSEKIFLKLQENNLIVSKKIMQLFDEEKGMFLSDRYVKGGCPECGALDQYGDNCEVCSNTYSSSDLINPLSVLSGTKPLLKESEHLFFSLSKLQKDISDWLSGSDIQIEVKNKVSEWLNNNLKDWDISRDEPYFGFKIPNHTGKYFYVWLDAPIGYISSHKNYLVKNNLEKDFNKYWDNNSKTELFHFIGKDVMYFHTLFFPAMLLKANFRQPNGIYVHGFLTVNGKKMSKSRGTHILARTYLDLLKPDYLRYFFASKLGKGIDDIDLNFEDFRARVNADLIGKFINIASRSAKFINHNYKNILSKNLHNEDLVNTFIAKSSTILKLYENREFNKAMREIMLLADEANRYIDKMEPWILIKEKKNDDLVHSVCTTSLNLFKILSIMLKPTLPDLINQIESFLNIEEQNWDDLKVPLLNHKVSLYQPLLTRIEEEKISKLIEYSKE